MPNLFGYLILIGISFPLEMDLATLGIVIFKILSRLAALAALSLTGTGNLMARLKDPRLISFRK